MSIQKLLLVVLLAATSNLAESVTCSGTDLIPCYLQSDGSVSPTGQFICRERYNMAFLEVVPTPLCVPQNSGRATDTCGCCNGGCPIPCFEPCPIDGNVNNVGVYVYDWWSWRPRRVCDTLGGSVQLKQQNSARWACVPHSGFFWRLFSFRSETSNTAEFSLFDTFFD